MKKKHHDKNAKDLESLYRLALEKENLAIAVKIKELQIKRMQLQTESGFEPHALSDKDIENLIAFLEEQSEQECLL